uniref:Granulins domain-containing protein n=1 Tax=Aegilops tauschii TaxID=37682 RepID=R7W386_AEGTA
MRSLMTSLVAALMVLLLSARAAPAEPSTASTVCDGNHSCPEGATCCCIYRQGEECFTWTCCPLQGTPCCDDGYSCCPQDYGFCDTNLGTCLMHCHNFKSSTDYRHVVNNLRMLIAILSLPLLLDEQGQDSPLSVKALKRTMAKPHWAFSSGPKGTNMSESTEVFDTCDSTTRICSTL